MTQLPWIPILVALTAASVAAVTDIWRFRVYNVLTFPLMACGLIYHSAATGYQGFTASCLGLMFGLAVLLLPYVMGLMGAGDVKLLAGVGAWLGLGPTVVVFVVSSLVAGVYATVLILYRGNISHSVAVLKLIFYRTAALGVQFGRDDLIESFAIQSDRRLRLIPYGAMIPLGVIGAMVWANWQ